MFHFIHVKYIKQFKIVLWIIFVIITGIENLYTQQIKFERLSTKQGLSQSSVTCIAQDSTGFLWFGTYDGLHRYDGFNFKIFKNETHNVNSISYNFVRSICLDRQGDIWFGTYGGGLNKYNSEYETFTRYQHDPNDSTSISHDIIYSIFEDKHGNLWIGTWGGGLNKMVRSFKETKKNGEYSAENISFIHYNFKFKDDPNAGVNKITSIFEDNDGLLWIGTRFGIIKIEPKTGDYIHYVHNPEDHYSLSSNNISAICADKNGNIWIGTWGEGINKYNKKNNSFIRYPYDNNNNYSVNHNIIMSMYQDRSKNLWIGTWGGGLYKLVTTVDPNNPQNKSKDSFQQYKNIPDDPHSLSDNSIYAIYEDRTGVLWVGTDWNGLNKYNKSGNKFLHYQSVPDTPFRLNQNTVFSLYKDLFDILWIGTRNGGINLYNNKLNKYTYLTHDPDDPTSLSNDIVRTIYQDRSGGIWVGTEFGLNMYDRKTKKFHRYSVFPEDPTSTNVFTILEDRYGYLWLGNYGGGLCKYDREKNKFIYYRHDPDNPGSISDNIIWTIFEDKGGTLWIGTEDGGLNKYDRENDTFIHFKNDPNNSTSLSDNKVLTMYQDNTGQIWIGTTSGLNKLIQASDKKSEPTFICYKKKNGLPTNTIHGILEDNHGNLWISTNNGLSKFNPINETFKNFDTNDGLQDKEFSVNACFKDKETGEMYLGGVNGFNVFHPDSICDNTILPSIVITNLKIFNKTIPIGKDNNGRKILTKSITETDEIILSYRDVVITFEYAALHFNSPENNQYAYMLEGFDKEWNYVATQRLATYTNLDPGNYIFKVKASNNDGIWNNEGVSLRIIITPPYWNTALFRIILIFILFSIIYIGYQVHTHRIRTQNKKLELRVKERTAQLEESNKELEAFSYSISHDLRTPLRGMNGFSLALLEDYSDKLDNKGNEYLQRIRRGSQHMGQLIDDLLKLSRLTRTQMNIRPINMSQLAQSIAEEYQEANPERKVKFSIANNLKVKGDRDLIKVMLRNLIDNSWKFTSKSHNVKIEIGSMYKMGKKVFYIKDNGIGFDMEYAEKMFEVFERQHSGFDGTGIGLATVKRIIVRHGGKIWAEGKENKGAIFFFTFDSK